ncbi:MAG: hypothetical protein GWN00_08095 [Aliifodinibius sp.]|nr:YtxH domain-containing protein [Fodinibius sp.]NIW44311.1 hypothetical protein [Gammaproteobacteria bacterium]NIX02310.1 hypothetical protein [Phycisphaerae bacterium]NIY24769.1 hypothetical protein [Fodinibius sp.]
MSRSNGEGIGFLKGLLIGGLVATAVTLLYAPKEGRKVRRDLRKRSAKFRDDMEDNWENAYDRAERFFDDTEKRITTIRKDTESAINDLRDRITDFKDALDDKVKIFRR